MTTRRRSKQRLQEGLKQLRLPTMRSNVQEVAAKARAESLSYEQDVRRQHRIERALRASHLPLEKTLQTFDRKRLPRKVDAHVNGLLEGTFLQRCENVLAFGPPGSGKTHLLCAIGYELVHADYRVRFRQCSMLVQELLAAKRDLELPRMLKQLDRYHALVIDDIGYVQQSREEEEMEVLFNLLAHRYERGSVMVTSNLPFSKGDQIFKDQMTTAAAIDRLVHHCVVLELVDVLSFRLEESKRRGNG